MNICDDDHEEVCHEGRQCPVCLLVEKIARQDDELMELRKQIIELERGR